MPFLSAWNSSKSECTKHSSQQREGFCASAPMWFTRNWEMMHRALITVGRMVSCNKEKKQISIAFILLSCECFVFTDTDRYSQKLLSQCNNKPQTKTCSSFLKELLIRLLPYETHRRPALAYPVRGTHWVVLARPLNKKAFTPFASMALIIGWIVCDHRYSSSGPSGHTFFEFGSRTSRKLHNVAFTIVGAQWERLHVTCIAITLNHKQTYVNFQPDCGHLTVTGSPASNHYQLG